MITNFLASIITSLVTNVTTMDNAVYEWSFIPTGPPSPQAVGTIGNPPPAVFTQHAIYYEPLKERGRLVTPATEKTEITTIKEVRHGEFDWFGEKKILPISEKFISATSVTYRKNEEWKQIKDGSDVTLELRNGLATNAVFFTNSSLFATSTNLTIK